MNEARRKGQFTDESVLRNETEIVVQCLRVNTLSKLTYSDSSRFDSLTSDVFRGVPFVNTGLESLINFLEESCLELGLQVNNRQVCTQLCIQELNYLR